MIRWFTSFVRSYKHLASEHRRRRRARDVNALKENPFEADDEDEETTVDGECTHYSSLCDVFRMQAQTLKKYHHFRDLQSGTLPKIVTVQLLHLFPTSVFADLHSFATDLRSKSEPDKTRKFTVPYSGVC